MIYNYVIPSITGYRKVITFSVWVQQYKFITLIITIIFNNMNLYSEFFSNKIYLLFVLTFYIESNWIWNFELNEMLFGFSYNAIWTYTDSNNGFGLHEFCLIVMLNDSIIRPLWFLWIRMNSRNLLYIDISTNINWCKGN